MPTGEIGSSREWGVPPLEPLSIRTADFERVPALEQPMMAEFEEVDLPMDLDTGRAEQPYIEEFDIVHEPHGADTYRAAPPQAAPQEAAPQEAAPQEAVRQEVAPARSPYQPPYQPAPVSRLRPSTENSDRLAAVTAAPQAPNASERQRIVTIRVCTVGEARWSGEALMAALELHGLAYGRYQVYHRKHSDGRSIFCVASLVEPGTFDMARMPEEEFRGVTLFAVLPGPLEAVQTVDALFATARDLARDLSGTVQDVKGMPFSPQRAAALREDIARFQAALSS
jgi:cell division protein ZipA